MQLVDEGGYLFCIAVNVDGDVHDASFNSMGWLGGDKIAPMEKLSDKSGRVPLYLVWFFLRIRHHSGEPDYFVTRYKDMPKERMILEAHMVKELHGYGLIAIPDKTVEKVFDPLTYSPEPGTYITRDGSIIPEVRVPYVKSFVVTPAGHYLLRESFCQFLGGMAWTICVAIASGFIGACIGSIA